MDVFQIFFFITDELQHKRKEHFIGYIGRHFTLLVGAKIGKKVGNKHSNLVLWQIIKIFFLII